MASASRRTHSPGVHTARRPRSSRRRACVQAYEMAAEVACTTFLEVVAVRSRLGGCEHLSGYCNATRNKRGTCAAFSRACPNRDPHSMWPAESTSTTSVRIACRVFVTVCRRTRSRACLGVGQFPKAPRRQAEQMHSWRPALGWPPTGPGEAGQPGRHS